MTAARLAARCVELLGAVEGPIAVAAARPVIDAVATHVAVANGDAAVGGAVCVFLDERIVPQVREATLDALAARLPTGASLVVVDHNQPRAAWRRLIGVLALALRGHGPARARHPVAREVRDHGFTIERLRLDEGERVQLVLARRR